MVRERGLEPPPLARLEPKSSASTNSATRAWAHLSANGRAGQRAFSLPRAPATVKTAPRAIFDAQLARPAQSTRRRRRACHPRLSARPRAARPRGFPMNFPEAIRRRSLTASTSFAAAENSPRGWLPANGTQRKSPSTSSSINTTASRGTRPFGAPTNASRIFTKCSAQFGKRFTRGHSAASAVGRNASRCASSVDQVKDGLKRILNLK